MMKYLALIVLVITFWGCAPVKEPAAVAPSVTAHSTSRALAPVTASKTPLDSAPGSGVSSNFPVLSELTPDIERPTTSTAETFQSTTSVAPAGVIDLSEINQERIVQNDQDLVELPAPGLPDPQARLVELVKRDLAIRLDLNESDIVVTEIEVVRWPDSSLGCPAPGVDYLMVLVSGYRLTVEVGADRYTYHTDTGEQFLLCENGRPAGP